MGTRFSTRPANSTPLTNRQKFVTDDYVGDLYLNTKFGARPPTGAGLGRKCVKYNEILFICLFITSFWGTHLSDQLGRFSRLVDGRHLEKLKYRDISKTRCRPTQMSKVNSGVTGPKFTIFLNDEARLSPLLTRLFALRYSKSFRNANWRRMGVITD